MTRRRLGSWIMWWFVGAAAVVGFLSVATPPQSLGWAGVFGLTAWLYVGIVVFASVRSGIASPLPGSPPVGPPRLGAATVVTLARALLLALAASFIPLGLEGLASEPILLVLPGILYAIAAIGDHLDGKLARRLEQASRLGAKLDMEVDAMGILIASVLAVRFGKVGVWFLLVGLARYLFVAGLELRRIRGRATADLDPLPLRRELAGFQMGFLAVSLFPQVPSNITMTAAPVFAGATLLLFVRDWLVASTRWSARSGSDGAVVSLLERSRPWFTVMVRLGLGVLLLQFLAGAPSTWPAPLVWSMFIALVLLLTGFAARLAAAWVLVVMILSTGFVGFDVTLVTARALVAGSSLVLLFGAGPLPIRHLMATRHGRQRGRPVQAH